MEQEKGRGKEEKEELSREDVMRVIRKLKNGKAMGVDGIPGEEV